MIGKFTPWLICFLLGTFFSINISAQLSSTYTYTTNNNGSLGLDMNGNVLDMSSGTTQLLGPGVDNQITPLVNIGFDFYWMGFYYNNFSCVDNGVVEFGNNSYSTTFYNASFSTANILAPYSHNLRVGLDGE